MAPQPTVALDTNLNRTAILAALSEAGTVLADGQARDADLNGRTISVRLPFGCDGTTAAGRAFHGLPSVVRGDDGSLMLTIMPEDLNASPWITTTDAAAGSGKWEAIEGFWIARPWSRMDTCGEARGAPPVEAQKTVDEDGPRPDRVVATPTPANDSTDIVPERTAALAAVIETGSSRLGRRPGQPYVHVIRGDKGSVPTPSPRGYALRLEGRLTTFSDDKAIHCVQQDRQSRPACVAALRLDRLAFEDGASGAVLSEWRPR